MKKFSGISFQCSVLFLVGALLAAPSLAQDKAAANPPAESAKSAEKPLPPPAAKFLADYDKLLTLGEARADAEKKRAEYEAATKVLAEQINALAAELRAQIPKDAVWDPAKRLFVRRPELAKPKEPSTPPAKSPEKKP